MKNNSWELNNGFVFSQSINLLFIDLKVPNTLRGCEVWKMTEETNKIIERELFIWKNAYPKSAKVLEKFANKLKFELQEKNWNDIWKRDWEVEKFMD